MCRQLAQQRSRGSPLHSIVPYSMSIEVFANRWRKWVDIETPALIPMTLLDDDLVLLFDWNCLHLGWWWWWSLITRQLVCAHKLIPLHKSTHSVNIQSLVGWPEGVECIQLMSIISRYNVATESEHNPPRDTHYPPQQQHILLLTLIFARSPHWPLQLLTAISSVCLIRTLLID